jgi:hypothetical protein
LIDRERWWGIQHEIFGGNHTIIAIRVAGITRLIEMAYFLQKNTFMQRQVRGIKLKFVPIKNPCQLMAENATSWFPEHHSWLKTTVHGRGRRPA